ncbi:MAG: hypothetical protein C3F06_13560 [Candidatus Methanoperedenaceae archaeon]|nr:MAG: hypothetical protein C3F06_13560 [Candidatus Methanoperedenaceae archaeon]
MTDYSEFIFKNFYKMEGYRIFFPRRNPAFNNPEFEKATLRVLIIRLSPLQNIRESITHHFLYQEIRRDVPLAYIDYAFFPEQKNMRFFKENNIPFFLGIQSLHPINDFDLVLISNSFTLELFNLPYLFSNTGSSGLKSNRETLLPIVIMGGSNVLMAQCAISDMGDSFVDALFFGEGEGAVGRISTIINENKEKPKREILTILEKEVKGLFDIRMPVPDSISVSSPVHASYILTDYPILNTDIENKAKLQITRGCPCFCSFCFEGHTRKPFREFKPEDIYSKALEVKRKHAPVEFDFLSFNFNFHTGISKIIADLNEMAKFVNFKSQRIDIIAMSPELLDLEILSGKRTFTFGVEGINDRMRRFLHKSLSEKDLLLSLEHVYSRRPRQIKLFFIITGLENKNDCREFKDFIMKLKNLKAKLSPGCRTIMSFGLMTNLPFTPMQFSQTIKDPEKIKQIKGDIKRDCETNNFEFRMSQDIEDFLICQHIVLAGFECFDVICGFAKNGGYYSGENIIGDKTSLIMGLRSASGDRIYDAKDMNYVFPFESVKGTPVKSFLFRMYNKAGNFTDNGYCLEGRGDCIGCGGCEERKLLSLPEVRKEDLDRIKIAMERKKRPVIVQAEVSLKESGRHLTPEAKCSFIGKAILEQLPALARDYLACRQVQNMEASKGYGFLFGRFLYDFEFSGSQEIFISHLKENIIDSSLLSISLSTGKEIGNDFRIVSQWNDPLQYSFQNHLQKYLQSKGLGFDIKKQEPFIRFEVAVKDRKKKFLNRIEFQQEKNKVALVLETGSNFLIIDMLKYLFLDGWMDAKVESM